MLQDLGYAVRTLKKTPGFTAVAVLSLALGIGANSAIFSLADGLLLRPMPVPNPAGVMAVRSQMRGESLGGVIMTSPVSYLDYVDLRDRNKSFAGLAAGQFTSFGYAADKANLPQMKFGMMVSGNFFDVLSLQPALGRFFRPDEDRVPGRDAVAVIGYDLWKTEFSSSPDTIGKTVYLNGIAFTIVGVSPEPFIGPHPLVVSNLYIPLAMCVRLTGDGQPNPLEKRGNRAAFVFGRLKPGVTVQQAAAEGKVISQQLALAYPETNRTCTLIINTDLKSRLADDPLDTQLIVFLLVLAGVVLLIACANVMNLMLSRGRARSREIAVRLAIGAGRGRLVRQMLTESLVVALLGGVFGLVVAQAGVDLFSQFRVPGDIPIVLRFDLNPRVLLYTLGAAVVSAVVFGLIPALRSTRNDLTPALKPGGLDAGKRRQFRGRNSLVVVQVTGSLLLLILASQAYRGVSILLSSPLGFRTDHILSATFDPALARYSPAQTQEFYKRLLDRARTLPQVNSAAISEVVPLLEGGNPIRAVPEGYQLPAGTDAVSAISDAVSEDYFTTFDIPIVEGRAFAVTDRADSPQVAIVNQLFARKYYLQGAVGKRFRLDNANGKAIEIIGVARQSKYLFPVEPPIDYVYLPMSQHTDRTGMTLVLHTAIPPGDLAPAVRNLVRSLDPGQPVIGMRTMDEIFEQRARKTLDILIQTIAGMGTLGLVLALVGLYGLMTYSVGLRQREIGIRMAIGADRPGVVKMVLRQGLTLAVVGVAIGLLLWVLASKPVMGLVGARSFSWSLLALVAAGLLGAAAVGAYLPARRASLVDPNTVLRQE